MCLRQSVPEDLITGYMITGVKLARTVYRLSYGTREVNIALQNRKRKQSEVGYSEMLAADQIVVVMKTL